MVCSPELDVTDAAMAVIEVERIVVQMVSSARKQGGK